MPARIPFHRPAGQPDTPRDYARSRMRLEDNRFYSSSRWRKLRSAYLAEHPLCVKCLEAGEVKASEHVHHVLDRKSHPELAFEWSNFLALCEPCHGSMPRSTAKAPRPPNLNA